MKRLLLLLLALPVHAEDARPPEPQHWSFDGPFGTFDRASLQRGFQVYREVCSACHGLTRLKFADLAAPGGPSFSEEIARKIAAGFNLPAGPNAEGEETDDKGFKFTRPATLADRIPSPFANEGLARASNNGALPPDLSLIVKGRAGGPDYVYAILAGFAAKPPAGTKVADGLYYNPYFSGHAIAMTQPLTDDAVTYADGTKASLTQEAKDVTAFLAWAADPTLEERHRMGFEITGFLVLLAGLLFLSWRKVWKDQD
jgi:ubiquinol-cytochrome c reductase cytochrome c1 subunit